MEEIRSEDEQFYTLPEGYPMDFDEDNLNDLSNVGGDSLDDAGNLSGSCANQVESPAGYNENYANEKNNDNYGTNDGISGDGQNQRTDNYDSSCGGNTDYVDNNNDNNYNTTGGKYGYSSNNNNRDFKGFQGKSRGYNRDGNSNWRGDNNNQNYGRNDRFDSGFSNKNNYHGSNDCDDNTFKDSSDYGTSGYDNRGSRGGRGRGGRGRGGWSSRGSGNDCNDEGEQRFGGFGDTEKRGGGTGCFKCGGPHFARDCTGNSTPGDQGLGDNTKKPRATYIPEESTDEEELFNSMSVGINFEKYQNIPVECSGNNPPKYPIESFMECNIDERLKRNVVRSKYEKPTPIQKWAIPAILMGRDIMGCAQTGSGKTAGFLLPVLTGMLKNDLPDVSLSVVQEPLTIIVGPTRELVMQIFNETKKFAMGTPIKSAVLYGGVSVSYQMKMVRTGAHIIVATPGRLMDFIRRGIVELKNVRYLILDEADRMLDMGFKDDILALCFNMGMPQKSDRQTLLFSATFPNEIQQIAASVLNEYIFIAIGRVGGANQDIEQVVELVPTEKKRQRLIDLLQSQPIDTKTIVFVEKKMMSDFLAVLLCQYKLPTTSIHGDREQREREEAIRTLKSGATPIIVATSVAARGLDITGIGHVVNYDLPQNIDEYVHRIGRTGRCGNYGKATSFFAPETDSILADSLVKILSEAQQEVPSWLEDLCHSMPFSEGFNDSTDRRYNKGKGRGRSGGYGEQNNECNYAVNDDENWS